ncbi:MAG: M2 family metallopeptidase [Myxococcota bacterium]|nr:M2 family metallopeptidase [Myxococcota bacterium]
MRKTFLLPLFLAAACGASKPETVPAPPPSGGEPTTDITPVAKPAVDVDAQLITDAKAFVTATDAELRKVLVAAAEAEWANQTDITPAHEEAAAKANRIVNDTVARMIKEARRFEPVLAKLDPLTRRQLQNLLYQMTVSTPIAPSPDDPKQAEELAKVAAEMGSTYGKGKVCEQVKGKQVCKDLDALSKTIQTTRKPDVALAAWKGWHDTVGRAERDLYRRYVPLANAGAKAIGFANVAEMWKSAYDMPADAFEAETDRLYNQLKPLYEQLHCYTRRKLNKMHGDKLVPKTGSIPAHLLGNMWAQTWGWLYKELEPYPGQAPVDVTPTLAKKGAYDEQKMVRIAEAFYTSLGMPALPDTFWQRSMFQKPAGKDAICHASAWDVGFNNDLRIKMCIQKTHEELDTIHHELGHNYYQSAYHKLPILLQNGANDGFHEAIGDTVVLSMTPDYLKQKGLLAKTVKNDKIVINRQMNTALEKVAFLPWGLMVDKWRWDVFSGKVQPDQYNDHWWALRKQYQGIVPPVVRAPTDFDPGAKYHVPANVPYMRYFLAAVLQFQFHRALCKKAGHTGPLHECSIYGNKAAGDAFSTMLAAGAAKPWQDILFDMTGEKAMDATAMLEYFAPLKGYLETQNQGQTCGW